MNDNENGVILKTKMDIKKLTFHFNTRYTKIRYNTI